MMETRAALAQSRKREVGEKEHFLESKPRVQEGKMLLPRAVAPRKGTGAAQASLCDTPSCIMACFLICRLEAPDGKNIILPLEFPVSVLCLEFLPPQMTQEAFPSSLLRTEHISNFCLVLLFTKHCPYLCRLQKVKPGQSSWSPMSHDR